MGVKIYRYIPTFLWVTGILVASFMPSSHISPSLYLFPHQDKVVHACMYFGLAFLFLLNSRHSFKITTIFFIISILSICAMSGLIEILQPILSSRTADIADFVANSIGALVGGGIVFHWIKSKEQE